MALSTSDLINLSVAIGTIAMAIASFWVIIRDYRDRRPHIKCIWRGTWLALDPAFGKDEVVNIPEYNPAYVITIANVGNRQITIQKILLVPHKGKTRMLFPEFNKPKEILPEKSKDFLLPLNKLIKAVRQDNLFKLNKKIKFLVQDFVGREYKIYGHRVVDFMQKTNKNEFDRIHADRFTFRGPTKGNKK